MKRRSSRWNRHRARVPFGAWLGLLAVSLFTVPTRSAQADGLELDGHIETALRGFEVRGDEAAFAADHPGVSPGFTFSDAVRLDAEGEWPKWRLRAHYDSDAPPEQHLLASLSGPDLNAAVGPNQAASKLPGLLNWHEAIIGATAERTSGPDAESAWVGESAGIPAHDSLTGDGTTGPFVLTFGPITPGSVEVSVAGRSLRVGEDVFIDLENQAIYFLDPVPQSTAIEVDYRYESEHPRWVLGGSAGRRVTGRYGFGAVYVQEFDVPKGASGWAPPPANPPLPAKQQFMGIGGGMQNGAWRVDAEGVISAVDAGGGSSHTAGAWRTALDAGTEDAGAALSVKQVGGGFTVPGLAETDSDYTQFDGEARYRLSPELRGILNLSQVAYNLANDASRPADRRFELNHTLRWEPDPLTRVDLDLGAQNEWDAFHPALGSSESRIARLSGRTQRGPWRLDAHQGFVDTVSDAPDRPAGRFTDTHLGARYAPDAQTRLDAAYDRLVQPPATIARGGLADTWSRVRMGFDLPLEGYRLQGELSRSQTAFERTPLDTVDYAQGSIAGAPFAGRPEWRARYTLTYRHDDWAFIGRTTVDVANSLDLNGELGPNLKLHGSLSLADKHTDPIGTRTGTIKTGADAQYTLGRWAMRGALLAQWTRGTLVSAASLESFGVRWAQSDERYVDASWSHGNLALGEDESDSDEIQTTGDDTTWAFQAGWTRGPWVAAGGESLTLGPAGVEARDGSLSLTWRRAPWSLTGAITSSESWWGEYTAKQTRSLRLDYLLRPGVTLQSGLNWSDSTGFAPYAARGWQLGLTADF